ncbi:sigma-G-dependent sporulation-specific acid-soluble spore protein CsgA [Neobacillus sp. PS3-34]|uniref:sigma-G-dependent sporulation-specific acid-soluble spore protein CsgA n=1 Tax=Neobacillus sp. PS3-34 TaxID=3070678 RepID=UPI0027DF8BE9|nr:sigma-G-dependent sporulation-specific acid-soluble spore protein CsgA [Neobacillus sp. PS3-34]WML47963.1 sigma-G-dependent sporulation-specific acid-soluble spore protein CsgA [Neobacillus sp. PS3-34]
MDKTLGYLREILSNYTEEHSMGRHIFHKLEKNEYNSEGSFVRGLNFEEIEFLNEILPKEIQYAKDEQDEKRAYELNEVFELLF